MTQGYGCGPRQKIGYSKAEAEHKVREMAEFDDDLQAPLTAYKCERCNR